MKIAHIIAQKLAADVGSLTLASNLFVGDMPDSPNEAVAVYVLPGVPPNPNSTAKTIHEMGVQVLVRAENYEAGSDLLELVRDSLHQTIGGNVTYNSQVVRLMSVLARSEGGSIGTDDKDRDEFSINFSVKAHVVS